MFRHSEYWKVKEPRNSSDVIQQECWEMTSACSYPTSLPYSVKKPYIWQWWYSLIFNVLINKQVPNKQYFLKQWCGLPTFYVA